MEPGKLQVLALVLNILSLAACGDDARSESAACSRYKALLVRSADADPQTAPPPTNGTYAAYRCRTAEELAAQGTDTLADCIALLEAQCPEGEPCSVPLGQAARARCKSNVLVYFETDQRLSADGVGAKCSLPFVPAEGLAPLASYLSRQPSCATQQCLVHGSADAAASPDDAYCSCRCQVPGADLPTCDCPSGFACSANLFTPAVASEGFDVSGGYCVRR